MAEKTVESAYDKEQNRIKNRLKEGKLYKLESIKKKPQKPKIARTQWEARQKYGIATGADYDID